jgi:hypothetical protein
MAGEHPQEDIEIHTLLNEYTETLGHAFPESDGQDKPRDTAQVHIPPGNRSSSKKQLSKPSKVTFDLNPKDVTPTCPVMAINFNGNVRK